MSHCRTSSCCFPLCGLFSFVLNPSLGSRFGGSGFRLGFQVWVVENKQAPFQEYATGVLLSNTTELGPINLSAETVDDINPALPMIRNIPQFP